MKYILSRHAEQELLRRGISRPFLDSVLEHPQQIVPGYGGKKAYQSQLDFGAGKILLLRAIVDERIMPPVVVTVYRTSKIAKYWNQT
jgi:Domain of unknown function (DUF4258)